MSRHAQIRNAMFVITACLALGCVGELEVVGGDPGSQLPEETGPVTAERQAFNTNVLPAITARTCGTCHIDTTCASVGDNVCFLGSNQNEYYDQLTASIYLGTSPATSTFANVGPHTGTGFCSGPGVASNGATDATCTSNQMAGINEWITMENAAAGAL